MATSSLLQTGEQAPTVDKGHGTRALGPSDTSDSGSDLQGGHGLVDDEGLLLDTGTNEDPSRGGSGAGPDIGDATLDSDSDSGGSGERGSAGRESSARTTISIRITSKRSMVPRARTKIRPMSHARSTRVRTKRTSSWVRGSARAVAADGRTRSPALQALVRFTRLPPVPAASGARPKPQAPAAARSERVSNVSRAPERSRRHREKTCVGGLTREAVVPIPARDREPRSGDGVEQGVRRERAQRFVGPDFFPQLVLR